MPRRMIYNSAGTSVSNGEQAQFQCDSRGALKTTSGSGDVLSVTFSLDTSAYASADLVADTQEIANALTQSGGRAILDSICILDEDDQGVALNFVFLNAATSLGTENAAPTISDANAANILGHVAIGTGDYLDIGGSKIATKTGIGLLLEGASGATSLYVAIVNGSGTPTFTASGLKVKFGFRQL